MYILHEYWELITDPAHTLVEFSFVLLDYLIIQLVILRTWRKVRNLVRREHIKIDLEHKVTHSQNNDSKIIISESAPDSLNKTD